MQDIQVIDKQEFRRFIETHHIERIPEEARHGKPWHQFAFWFGSNVNVFNLVLGGVLVTLYGLTFWWAVIATTIGTLIGALLIALHATQGPKLGVPQTIQSRGQFGFYGATFMFPAVLLLNIGFIAAQLIIQAQSMHGVVGSLSITTWIIILAVPAVVIGVFGYRWIHRVMQATAVVVGVSLIIMLVQGLNFGSLPASETSMQAPSVGLFLAGVALLTIDMLSFGPFVSDYTRYLPAETNGKRLFWAIYGGNIVATIGSTVIGAYIAALLPKEDSIVGAVGAISGKWALVIMAFSLVNACTFNAYTGAFQVLSLANMFTRLRSASTLRIVPFVVVMAVGTVVAFIGHTSFVTNLTNFLDVLLLIFIPWSAVNLADYFIVRRGNYNVASFFTASGQYGRFMWPGLVAYAIGLLVEWPFVDQTDYIGPFVNALGGADISWLIGWIIAAGAYLLLVRVQERTASEPVPSPQFSA